MRAMKFLECVFIFAIIICSRHDKKEIMEQLEVRLRFLSKKSGQKLDQKLDQKSSQKSGQKSNQRSKIRGLRSEVRGQRYMVVG